jgi:hypothetical protein
MLFVDTNLFEAQARLDANTVVAMSQLEWPAARTDDDGAAVATSQCA